MPAGQIDGAHASLLTMRGSQTRPPRDSLQTHEAAARSDTYICSYFGGRQISLDCALGGNLGFQDWTFWGGNNGDSGFEGIKSAVQLHPDVQSIAMEFGDDVFEFAYASSEGLCEAVERAIRANSSIYGVVGSSILHFDMSSKNTLFLHFWHRFGALLAAHEAPGKAPGMPVTKMVSAMLQAVGKATTDRMTHEHYNAPTPCLTSNTGFGMAHGIIWQTVALMPPEMSGQAVWEALMPTLATMDPLYKSVSFSIHGVGHGMFLRALLRHTSFNLTSCPILSVPWADAPANDFPVAPHVAAVAEELCFSAPRTGPRAHMRDPWVGDCLDGMYHTLWETVPLNTTAPWTHLCGEVPSAFPCLISRL
jgi:hypothetical protein